MPFGLPDFENYNPVRLPSFGMGESASALRRPLPAEQRQSFGQELLDRGKSGLSAVLDTLQAPGDYLRGGLAGKFGQRVTGRKLLERYGVVSPGDRGWGAWGLGLGADVLTDPFTYATFGAKHAFNPGGRAVHKLGELRDWNRKELLGGFHKLESDLSGAGATADEIAHLRAKGERIATPNAEAAYQAAAGKPLRAGAPLSDLARFSVPFSPDLGFGLGHGRIGRGVGGGLDVAGDWLKFRNPVGRQINSLFDVRVGRATDEVGQRSHFKTWNEKKALESQARIDKIGLQEITDPLVRKYPHLQVAFSRAGRVSAEKASPLALLGSITDPTDRAVVQQALADFSAPGSMGEKIRNTMRGQFEAGQRKGLVTKRSNDLYAEYVPRQATAAEEAGVGGQLQKGSISPTVAGYNFGRKKLWRDTPGATDRSNDWANRFAGNRDRKVVGKAVYDDMVADYTHLKGAAPPQDVLDAFEVKAFGIKGNKKAGAKRQPGIADLLRRMPADKYLGKIETHPLFTHNLPSDVYRRSMAHARTMSGAEALQKGIATLARKTGAAKSPDLVPVSKALKSVGLGSHDLGTELVGAGPQTYRKLALKGAADVAPLTQGTAPYGLETQLKNWSVPREQFRQLAHSYNNWVAPEEMIKPIKIWDSVTNSFKALAYPIWAASQVRNAATAFGSNLRTGTLGRDMGFQTRLMRGALPEDVAREARRFEYGHGRVFDEGGPNLELAGAHGAVAPEKRRWLDYPPGTNKHGMGQAGPTGSFLGDTARLLGTEGIGDLGKGVWNKLRDWKHAPNPFQLSGVGEKEVAGKVIRHRDVFAPVKAGRQVSSNIENFFRGAQMQGLKRQGYAPEMAAEQMRKYHFDYQDLTPFEKNWMRRAVPFYTFSRKNLPLQLETLATRPGAFSTPFKPTQVDRDQENYVPDYLSGGFVMPMGAPHDGTQRFISSLGLPQEEAVKEFALWNGRPDLQRTAQAYAGNLNPLLKGPLEQLTGTQLYSGRKLSELRPTAAGAGLASLFSDEAHNRGNPLAQLFTQAISNTPLTRFATSLDKILDTKGLTEAGRKPGWATAVNLLTGGRITDVDLGRQRHFDQMNALTQGLSREPHVAQFTNYYPRPEDRKLVTPEEAIQLRMLAQMQEQSREYVARQRRLRPAAQ